MILFGQSLLGKIINWQANVEGMIDKEDLSLFHYADTPQGSHRQDNCLPEGTSGQITQAALHFPAICVRTIRNPRQSDPVGAVYLPPPVVQTGTPDFGHGFA